MTDTQLHTVPNLILASSSRYRARLLSRLQIPFRCEAPNVDETALANETSPEQALRLAVAKAQAITSTLDDPLFIGSDQTALCEGLALTKPGTEDRAREQLRHCAGNTVVFHTGLALWHPASRTLITRVVDVEVDMRNLTDREIDSYIKKDDPLDCAGSFKWESLGISLFSAIRGTDPTALEGLPLIALCDGLRALGYRLP